MFESTITVNGVKHSLVLDHRTKTWGYVPQSALDEQVIKRLFPPSKMETGYRHGADGDFLITRLDFS